MHIRFRTIHWPLALVLGVVGCNSPSDPSASPSPVEKDTVEDLPRTQRAVHSAHRAPRVTLQSAPEWSAGPEQNTVSITGSTITWDQNTPTEWLCPSLPCDLPEILSPESSKSPRSFSVFVAPEVSALALTEWVRTLSKNDEPVWIATSADGSRDFALPLAPGPEIRALPTPISPVPGTTRVRSLSGRSLKSTERDKSPIPEGPKVAARGLKLTLDGLCDDRTIARDTRRNLRSFIGCYRDYAEREDPEEGTVTFRWNVTPEGTTSAIEVSSTDLADLALNNCLKGVLKEQRYAPLSTRPTPCNAAWGIRFRQREVKEKPLRPTLEEASVKRQVRAYLGQKSVSLQAADSIAQQLFRLEDPDALREALSQHARDGILLLSYKPATTAQQVYELGALALESGVKTIKLIHPPDDSTP